MSNNRAKHYCKKVNPHLTVILKAVADYWEVSPEWLNLLPDEFERVVITTALLDGRTRELVLQNPDLFSSGNFKNAAKCRLFPVAALIGEYPLIEEALFVSKWHDKSLQEAIDEALQKHYLNPLLVRFGKFLMQFTTEFISVYSIAPTDIVKKWRFDRLRQPRYFLHAEVSDTDLQSGMGYQEIVQLVPKQKRKFLSYDGFNYRPLKSERKKATLDKMLENAIREKLRKVGVQDETIFNEGLKAVKEAVLFDLEEAMNIRMESEKAGTASEETFIRSASKSADSRYYLSAVATGGTLGAGDIEFIVKKCMQDAFDRSCKNWKEAAATLISMAIWHPFGELETVKITGCFALSSIKRRDTPEFMDLHEQVGSGFYRVMPSALMPLYSELQAGGFPKCSAIKDYLKSLRPWFTCALLQQSLMTVCPTRWNFPPVLPILGFYPLNEKSPALRSYCRVDDRFLRRCESWIKLFDPSCDLSTLNGINKFRSCGSPNVPKLAELRDFSSTVKLLLESELPSDATEALCTFKALSSGFHLLGNVLLGGLRNWPMIIPREAECGWFGFQKSHYLYTPSCLIREYLPTYRTRLDELLTISIGAGIQIDAIKIRNTSICLLDIDSNQVLAPTEFSWKAMVEAFTCCPKTWKWKGFYPRGMRHFSMTELYAAGFPSNDIEAFHHRSLSSLHPFRIHRLEPVSNIAVCREMEAHLRRIINL